MTLNSTLFDIDLAKRSGVFITGKRGVGKTNLAMNIVDTLIQNNIDVIVFDPSRAWRYSSIENYTEIPEHIEQIRIECPTRDSIVYDLSLLYVYAQKEIIRNIVAGYFRRQVRDPDRWRIFVFEECQTLIHRNRLSSREAQEILRLITVGRNFKLSYILLTTRPSLVDTSLVALSDQIYIGRLDDINDIRRVKRWIGVYEHRISRLKTGQFIYRREGDTKLIDTPLFRNIRVEKKTIPVTVLRTRIEV